MRPCLPCAVLAVIASCKRDAPVALPVDAALATPADAAPEVVTHASMIADGGPGVTAVEAIDGDALRKRHAPRLRTPAPVTILRGASARDLGERICQSVVPQKPQDTPILIKPNIGGFDWFKDRAKSGGDDGIKGRITDPEFTRGIVRCLKARGMTKITIAEGWGATYKDWERLVKVSGYEVMAREEGVPLVALDDDGVFDVQEGTPGKPLGVRGMEKTHVPTLLVPKLLADVLDHGLFISAPKVKAHRFGVVSMSVKGVQGTIMLSDASPAFRQKWRMHIELNKYLKERPKKDDRALYVSALETFAERIADVLEVETPDVVLADGAPMMAGDGFQKLFPSEELVAIGGVNPVLVDRVGAQLLGLWDNDDLARELGGHRTSPLIEAAAKRFGLDLASPVAVGDGAALLHEPRPTHFYGLAPFVIEGSETERPQVHAARVDGDPPKVDGRGDDAAWASANEVAWDTDFAGRNTGIVTRARFVWKKDALYMLWELASAGLHADPSRPLDQERPKLYEEDCVELFFTPDVRKPSHYYEVELGPLGHFFDIDVDSEAKKSDTSWSSGVKVATTRDAAAHTASIEAVLSSPDVTRALAPNARLRLGLYRMEGASPRSYLAWSPPKTEKPNFHVPSAFGTLVVDP
jgi:uncharacterized protein (DUF362 family)